MAKKQHKGGSVKQTPGIEKTLKKSLNIKEKNIYHLLLRLFILMLIVSGVVYYTDTKSYFNPDEKNNHTERKWEAFYDFTKHNDVDVVLVGNSRLYTGINPKHLSCALGANCFLLASPGTTLSDAYYCLKEAISVCKPKIAVVETRTIYDYDSYNLSSDGIFNQFKSFYARKNVFQKLESMPKLFSPENYLAAWSNTIRNHSFIISDREQIKRNINHQNKLPEFGKLYLGRYVRFTSGIEDSILKKINSPETKKEDGNMFCIGNEAKKYIKKTVELCEKNNVQLIFLTVPIYKGLVANYDIKHSKLENELSIYNSNWLDLQEAYDSIRYRADCFENIASAGQHMTYLGSLVTSYKLAHFIHEKMPDILVDRSENKSWRNLFHGEEGYFENYMPETSDSSSISVIAKNLSYSNLPFVKEIDIRHDEKQQLLMAKISRGSQNLYNKIIRLTIFGKIKNKFSYGIVDLVLARDVDPVKHYLFIAGIRKDVKIIDIKNIQLLAP